MTFKAYPRQSLNFNTKIDMIVYFAASILLSAFSLFLIPNIGYVIGVDTFLTMGMTAFSQLMLNAVVWKYTSWDDIDGIYLIPPYKKIEHLGIHGLFGRINYIRRRSGSRHNFYFIRHKKWTIPWILFNSMIFLIPLIVLYTGMQNYYHIRYLRSLRGL